MKIYKFFIFLIMIFYIVHFTLYISKASALESTSSATPSSEFKLKVKQLQDEIASKAARFKSEISKKLQNKAYVGFIKSKSDRSLTVATGNGIKIITVNEYTQYSDAAKTVNSKTYQKKSSRLINLKDLESENYIAALGDTDDNGVLTAKRVIRTVEPSPVPRQLFFGQINSAGEKSFNIRSRDGSEALLAVDAETTYQTSDMKEAGGVWDELPKDTLIIVTATKTKAGILKARFVYFLSSEAPILKVQTSTTSSEKSKR